MKKFKNLFTPHNRKALYITLSLVALAIAGGAPGAGSGIGSGFRALIGF